MPRWRVTASGWATVAAVSVVLAGCSSSDEGGQGPGTTVGAGTTVQGTVPLPGSSSVPGSSSTTAVRSSSTTTTVRPSSTTSSTARPSSTTTPAVGVACGDAVALVRQVNAGHNFYDGPRSFSMGGYQCSVVTSTQGLPVGNYTCTSGAKTVSWTKS
jgi:hypothetical protein